MNYFVIDFETANSKRDSACALGIVEINNNEILREWNYIINPEDEFDAFNTHLHGISFETVKDKPTFPMIWNEIKSLLQDNIVIAHNASFDISVLRHVLNKYDLEFPSFRYSCTRILSKMTWESLTNYKLNTIAKYLNITFHHHNQLEDSKACAKIFTEILKSNNISDFEELHNTLKIKIGCIFPQGYEACSVKNSSYSLKSYLKPKDIIPSTEIFDINHEFYNKGLAFTGTLSMSRKDAALAAVNKGAFYCNSVTKKTNYLVLGVQDYSKFIDGEKSSKLRKAEDLILKGQDLEIISEDEFLNLL